MPPHESTRRHLLKTIPATLSLGLAGCLDTTTLPNPDPNYEEPNQPQNNKDTTDDGPINKQPNTPAATFKYQKSKDIEHLDTYAFTELPQFTGITPPIAHHTGRNNLRERSYAHPDTNSTTIEVTKTTATVTIHDVKLARALDLTLHVRTNTNKDDYQTTSTKLTPQTEGGDTTFTTYTLDFDITTIPQPMNKSGFIELAATDSATSTTYSLKRHQYVAFKTEDATRWVNNNGHFNLRHYHSGAKSDIVTYQTDSYGYFEYENLGIPNDYDGSDGPPDRRIYMATRSNLTGELIAGTTKINGQTYNQFEPNSRYYHEHDFKYESRYANQISHLNELGRYLWDSLEYAGHTTPFAKLATLADLIQHMEYGNARGYTIDPPPTVVLYNLIGDCTSKTALYTSILRTNTWGGNYRTAAILCQIAGGDHIVVGLDERDFTPPDDRNVYYVQPSSPDLPDTRYAFLELTSDSRIGQFNENLYDIGDVYDTSAYKNHADKYSPEPPDY